MRFLNIQIITMTFSLLFFGCANSDPGSAKIKIADSEVDKASSGTVIEAQEKVLEVDPVDPAPEREEPWQVEPAERLTTDPTPVPTLVPTPMPTPEPSPEPTPEVPSGASAWQNPVNRCDVNADGEVNLLDRQAVDLLIDERRNMGSSFLLPEEKPINSTYIDVNGDWYLSPIDSLQVLACINDTD